MKLLKRLYFLLFILPSCIDPYGNIDIPVPTNSPVISNVPGAFSYVEQMSFKDQDFTKTLLFDCQSFVFSTTVLNHHSGSLTLMIEDGQQTKPLEYIVTGNTVISEIPEFSPSSISIIAKDFTGSVTISVAED